MNNIFRIIIFTLIFHTHQTHSRRIQRSIVGSDSHSEAISEVIVAVHKDGEENEKKNNGTQQQNSLTLDTDELDAWEGPYEMRKNFAYYHAGFDDDNRPVWVAEVGKWNFRLVTDAGSETKKTWDKYVEQIAHRVVKSIGERSTPEEPVDGVIVILDMEGFDLIKMSHLPTVSMLLRLLVKFRQTLDSYMHASIIVNTSAAAQGIFNLARPILGPIFQRAEIYGTNRANWLPHMLKHIPKNSLPEWYGGKVDFKPLKVYG